MTHLNRWRMKDGGFRKWIPSGHVSAEGFSLVEVVVALGIAAFALISIISLLPTGINSARDSVQTTEASQIAGAIDADLRASAARMTDVQLPTNSRRFGIPIMDTNDFSRCVLYFDEVGNTNPPASPLSKYRVTVTTTNLPFTTPSTPTLSLVSIRVTWPAAAPVSNASGSLELCSSFTRAAGH